ncbi:hypothetical protein [Aliikangiella sp. IMCC44632]
MRIKINVLILFLLLAFSGAAGGTTIIPGPLYFQPIHGTNAFVLPGPNASHLVRNCGANGADLTQHWQPSKEQVRIIDNKVNLALENIDPKSGDFKIIKLYFGLENDKNEKYIYGFIFPISMSEKLTIDFGEEISVCPRIESIVEFDLGSLKLKVLKPDITKAFNRWRKLPRHN